jgi:hypothetical protein
MDGGFMKLVIAIALLAPLVSLADYVPGRTRPTAESEMEAITGDGQFENAKSVRLVELTTDDKGVTQYELTVDGHDYTFAVNKASTGTCGDLYEASGETGSRLILRDMSFAECQYRAKHKWEAQVVSVDGYDRASHLFIGGDPEHLIVTQ